MSGHEGGFASGQGKAKKRPARYGQPAVGSSAWGSERRGIGTSLAAPRRCDVHSTLSSSGSPKRRCCGEQGSLVRGSMARLFDVSDAFAHAFALQMQTWDSWRVGDRNAS